MTDEKIEEQPQEEVVQEVQEEVKVEEAPKESPADINWKKATAALAAQKAEIEALRAELEKKTAPPVQPEKDEFADLDPDDYLTTSKAKAMAEKLAEKKAREAARAAVDEYAKQQNVATSEERARAAHEDYDYIIENFALPLIKNDPALAHKVANSKNPAETAYKLGKLSDAYEDSVTKQSVSPKAEKIMKNTSRPVSGNAVGNTLKADADKFSKMSRQEIWEQSQRFARGA